MEFIREIEKMRIHDCDWQPIEAYLKQDDR